MKRLALFILLCMSYLLIAQSHELPSLEVLGEGQMKIPLGPRTSLPFHALAIQDSLPDFIPFIHQNLSIQTPEEMPSLKARLAADFVTALSFKLSASLYHLHPKLDFVRADIQDRFFKGGFTHQDYMLGAAFDADSTLSLNLLLRYQDASVKSYQSNAFIFSVDFDTQDMQEDAWLLQDIHTRLWWENSSHYHGKVSTKHIEPGFWHRHTLFVKDHSVDNLLGTSLGRFAILSSYHSQLEYLGFKLQRAGLMSDMNHLLPALDLYWQKNLNPEWLLSFSNLPTLKQYNRSNILAEYHWAGQANKGAAQMAPLNLEFKLQHALPSFFGCSLSYLDNSPQNNVSMALKSSYIYNAAVLKQKIGTKIPLLSLQPKWLHAIQMGSMLRLPWGTLQQDLNINLEHLPHQSLIRAPYSPLIEANTSFIYENDDYVLNVSFSQGYFSKDHQGRSLPEALHLDLGASWYLMPQLILKAEFTNLLAKPFISFNHLPTQTQEFRIGAQYLWR